MRLGFYYVRYKIPGTCRFRNVTIHALAPDSLEPVAKLNLFADSFCGPRRRQIGPGTGRKNPGTKWLAPGLRTDNLSSHICSAIIHFDPRRFRKQHLPNRFEAVHPFSAIYTTQRKNKGRYMLQFEH